MRAWSLLGACALVSVHGTAAPTEVAYLSEPIR